MADKYILVDGKAVAEPDLMRWAVWFETADRQIGRDEVGDVLVSTVFLGVDYNWHEGPPLLFETMVFGGDFDGLTERYSTLQEAAAGHATIFTKVIEGGQ